MQHGVGTEDYKFITTGYNTRENAGEYCVILFIRRDFTTFARNFCTVANNARMKNKTNYSRWI